MIPLILQKLLKKLIASIISIVRRVGQGGWQTAYRSKAAKKLERRVADCEAEIEQTEAAISILEAKMATPEGASDMALYEQHQKLKTQLDSVMEEWDAVSCELEEARK